MACAVEGCSKQASCRGWCKMHYSRWYRHGNPEFRKTGIQTGPCIADGCNRPQLTGHLCGTHSRRLDRFGDVRAEEPIRAPYRHGRVKTGQGYIRIKVIGHPRGGKHGWVLEHIVVMEQKLGRALLRGENVHHINGVRDDNRPENLELWIVSQPSGQRVSDVVEWAKEILTRYD